MNSGELGSAGEAAEVSVEVSECMLCSFPLHAVSQPKVSTDPRGGKTRSYQRSGTLKLRCFSVKIG